MFGLLWTHVMIHRESVGLSGWVGFLAVSVRRRSVSLQLSYSVIAPLWGTQALLRQAEHKPKLMFPIVQNERARERLEATCLGASHTNAALLKEYGKSCFLVGEILSGKYLQNFTISARRLERPTKELKVFLSTH